MGLLRHLKLCTQLVVLPGDLVAALPQRVGARLGCTHRLRLRLVGRSLGCHALHHSHAIRLREAARSLSVDLRSSLDLGL